MAPPGATRILFKVTVLGDGGVGKTALTVQFTMSSFVEAYDPTIEDCYRKQWVVDDQPCLLEVLDTAGQEEYTSLRDQWIRDGEGFLIVYSIANRQTFERVERIVERVHRVKDVDPPQSPFSPNSPYSSSPHHSPSSPTSSTGYPQRQHAPGPSTRIPITLVGNKRDQVALREVSTEEGRDLAQRMGCDFFEASAKTNTNVEASFKSVVRQIKAQRRGADGGSGGGGGGGGGGGYGGGGGGHGKRRKKCVIL